MRQILEALVFSRFVPLSRGPQPGRWAPTAALLVGLLAASPMRTLALACEYELNGSGEIHECYLEYLFSRCVAKHTKELDNCLIKSRGIWQEQLCYVDNQLDLLECIDEEAYGGYF